MHLSSLRGLVRLPPQSSGAHEEALGEDDVPHLPEDVRHGLQHATAHGVQARPVKS